MSNYGRRKFLKLSAAGLAGTLWTPLIQRALAVEAFNATRSIQDVKHIVILMQENRSFDHYFGAKKGVRGFGDRFPIPLAVDKGFFINRMERRSFLLTARMEKRPTQEIA